MPIWNYRLIVIDSEVLNASVSKYTHMCMYVYTHVYSYIYIYMHMWHREKEGKKMRGERKKLEEGKEERRGEWISSEYGNLYTYIYACVCVCMYAMLC